MFVYMMIIVNYVTGNCIYIHYQLRVTAPNDPLGVLGVCNAGVVVLLILIFGFILLIQDFLTNLSNAETFLAQSTSFSRNVQRLEIILRMSVQYIKGIHYYRI
ncbi:hypothetical protein CAAN3_08S04126 [[Candida] anglica]